MHVYKNVIETQAPPDARSYSHLKKVHGLGQNLIHVQNNFIIHQDEI
jgi:hypothetical protein